MNTDSLSLSLSLSSWPQSDLLSLWLPGRTSSLPGQQGQNHHAEAGGRHDLWSELYRLRPSNRNSQGEWWAAILRTPGVSCTSVVLTWHGPRCQLRHCIEDNLSLLKKRRGKYKKRGVYKNTKWRNTGRIRIRKKVTLVLKARTRFLCRDYTSRQNVTMPGIKYLHNINVRSHNFMTEK